MAEFLIWLVAAFVAVGGVVLGRVWGRAEGKQEAERDAMAETFEQTTRGRDAVRKGRNVGAPAQRLQRNDDRWQCRLRVLRRGPARPTASRVYRGSANGLGGLDRRSRRPHDGNLPMKSLSPNLQAHLDEGTTTLAWCWRISRADNVTFGFTDHDRTLSFDGINFEPESGLTASEVRSGSDLSVDAQDAEGVLTSDRITETDILDGRWDNAKVEVWRVNWADTGQRVLMRRGAIGQIRRGRLAFVAEVRSLAHVLGQTVGRTFQATCDAALGDARCGVNLEDPAYKGAGAVIDPLRDRAFTASGLSGFTSGWFAFGTIEWTSGANAGRRTEVLGHDVTDGVAILILLEAPVRAIAEGDAFTIRAGCDKLIETCGAKFANTANFRGFPHIPGQDAVLRYATKDGGHEGGVL